MCETVGGGEPLWSWCVRVLSDHLIIGLCFSLLPLSFRVGYFASVCVRAFSCVSGSDSVCLNMSYEALEVLELKVTIPSLSLSTCMHCCSYLTHSHLCMCVSGPSHLSQGACNHATWSARLCAHLNVSLCLCLAVCPSCLYAQLIYLCHTHSACMLLACRWLGCLAAFWSCS